ncbi:MAG: NAD(P) transhydrogenase subunit alpha [Rhodospirillaceae bacterium]
MDLVQLAARLAEVQAQLDALQKNSAALGENIAEATRAATAALGPGGHESFFLTGLTVFVLAVFVGYHVVWRVTPALHSPLMAVTNAISSVIIVGALIAAGPASFDFSQAMGFIAVVLASVNIFGGFLVTERMLAMYKKKTK